MTLNASVTAIVNSSLARGIVPSSFKHAIILPLLKKAYLDPAIHDNYRPISKLPFMSKLYSYLNAFNILDTFQSGFRCLHNTESALLRVTNDILLSMYSGSPVVLVLLDLSAAFDTIDH